VRRGENKKITADRSKGGDVEKVLVCRGKPSALVGPRLVTLAPLRDVAMQKGAKQATERPLHRLIASQGSPTHGFQSGVGSTCTPKKRGKVRVMIWSDGKM